MTFSISRSSTHRLAPSDDSAHAPENGQNWAANQTHRALARHSRSHQPLPSQMPEFRSASSAARMRMTASSVRSARVSTKPALGARAGDGLDQPALEGACCRVKPGVLKCRYRIDNFRVRLFFGDATLHYPTPISAAARRVVVSSSPSLLAAGCDPHSKVFLQTTMRARQRPLFAITDSLYNPPVRI
jgi:hypothetical protein